jgi:hypothetical protein
MVAYHDAHTTVRLRWLSMQRKRDGTTHADARADARRHVGAFVAQGACPITHSVADAPGNACAMRFLQAVARHDVVSRWFRSRVSL